VTAKPLPFHGWITHWDYSRAEFERHPVNPWQMEPKIQRLASALAILEMVEESL
jgi:hypothetical protein